MASLAGMKPALLRRLGFPACECPLRIFSVIRIRRLSLRWEHELGRNAWGSP